MSILYMHMYMCTCIYLHDDLWRQVVINLLTLCSHVPEGYSTYLVCLSVCYHSSSDLVHFNARSKVREGLLSAI